MLCIPVVSGEQDPLAVGSIVGVFPPAPRPELVPELLEVPE
jgi:hypothetical protein